MSNLFNYRIYTDGSCLDNPGPGGFYALALAQKPEDDPPIPRIRGEMFGGQPDTTNNRMELNAVLQALKYELPEFQKTPLEIFSDSQYVVNAFNKGWTANWQQNGWRNAKGQPTANQDLWKELVAIVASRSGPISWNWTPGHSGDPYNEKCDRSARMAANTVKGSGQPFIEGNLCYGGLEIPTTVEGSAIDLPSEPQPPPAQAQALTPPKPEPPVNPPPQRLSAAGQWQKSIAAARASTDPRALHNALNDAVQQAESFKTILTVDGHLLRVALYADNSRLYLRFTQLETSIADS